MDFSSVIDKINEALNYVLIQYEDHDITVLNLLVGLIILALAPLFSWLLKRFILKPYFKRRNIHEGRSYALTRLVKYTVFVFVFMIAVHSTGIEIYAFWTAGAALLVGVGLGLQQTFNDFASGIILLFEGSVQKGDWIDVGETQGEVLKIGLRTSLIQTRRNVSIIVPNSKITVDNVINLSHNNSKRVRYTVSVGVAYGSELKRVKEILMRCADRHNLVLNRPSPLVRFVEFGNSSLNFELLFWSKEYHNIEDVRSDLRFMIDDAFRDFGITIPFPQRDLHLKEVAEIRMIPESKVDVEDEKSLKKK